MKTFDQFTQYSPEWWAKRRGVPTASEFHRIITAAKAEFAAGHKSYINDLIGDELDPNYGQVDDTATAAMKRGTVMEPEARALYKLWTGEGVKEVGFVTTDCGRFGSSPDGLVGADGITEYKCPTASVFAGYVLADVLPADYRAQCHGHLLVSGRKWCDFVAYFPNQPLFVKRVVRDEFTVKLADCLRRFDEAYRAARAKFGLPNPTAPLVLGEAEPVETAGDRLLEHAAALAGAVPA